MPRNDHGAEVGPLAEKYPNSSTRRRHSETSQIFQVGDSDYIKVLNAMQENGNALVVRGEYEVALDVFREVYEERRQLLGEEDHSTLSTRHQMAWARMSQGNLHEALVMFSDVYDRSKRRHGIAEELTLVARDNMAYVLSKMGRYAEALEMYKEVYRIEVRLHGKNYQRNLITKQCIAALHFHLGNYNVALDVFQDLYGRMQDVLGKDHALTMKNEEFMDEIRRIKKENDTCVMM